MTNKITEMNVDTSLIKIPDERERTLIWENFFFSKVNIDKMVIVSTIFDYISQKLS